AGQNALKGILGNPASFDPSGNINPSILPQVGAVDPNAMITLRSNMLADQTRQLQQQKQQLERNAEMQKLVDPIRIEAYEAYDSTQGDETAKNAAAQRVFTERLPELKKSGLLSAQEGDNLNTSWDLKRAVANSPALQGMI